MGLCSIQRLSLERIGSLIRNSSSDHVRTGTYVGIAYSQGTGNATRKSYEQIRVIAYGAFKDCILFVCIKNLNPYPQQQIY